MGLGLVTTTLLHKRRGVSLQEVSDLEMVLAVNTLADLDDPSQQSFGLGELSSGDLEYRDVGRRSESVALIGAQGFFAIFEDDQKRPTTAYRDSAPPLDVVGRRVEWPRILERIASGIESAQEEVASNSFAEAFHS